MTEVAPAAGSRNGIEGVYARHVEAIHRFCYRLLADRQAAEDATAHVFLQLARRWGQLSLRDEAALGHWLYGEARNAIGAHLRRLRQHRQALLEVGREELGQLRAPGQPADGIESGTLWTAIGRLKNSDRELVVLRFMEGHSLKDTAVILGKSRVAVRVGLMRALRKLRAYLGDGSVR